MSKVKDYIMTSVENQVDKISKDYIDGKIDLNTAENKIENIDNLEMYLDKNNIQDHLFYAKEDYFKKSNIAGGLQ
tara:strand:- start:362 stop:586 length:225 start_codon:yes stop_codon:yes gene_type:complete